MEGEIAMWPASTRATANCRMQGSQVLATQKSSEINICSHFMDPS